MIALIKYSQATLSGYIQLCFTVSLFHVFFSIGYAHQMGFPRENGTPSWSGAVSDLRPRDGISNFVKCEFATFLY